MEIRTASDNLRELARRATPGAWRTVPGEDGTTRLLARDDQEVAVFTGLWALPTAQYVTAVAPETAYLAAELMWLSESAVRKGEMPTRLRTAMHNLAKAFPQDLSAI